MFFWSEVIILSNPSCEITIEVINIYDEEETDRKLQAVSFLRFMDSFLTTVDSHTVLLVAAIAVSLLLLRLAVKVLNATWGLILAIAAIFVVLQYAFGIAPSQLLTEVSQLPQDLIQLMQNINLPELGILHALNQFYLWF